MNRSSEFAEHFRKQLRQYMNELTDSVSREHKNFEEYQRFVGQINDCTKRNFLISSKPKIKKTINGFNNKFTFCEQ